MEIVVRATVMFFFLWVVARGTGKRELSEMTAFELILLVTMGDLIQQAVTQEDMSLTGAMLAVGTVAFWILVFSYGAFRFRRARKLIEGTALVIIRDGALVDEALNIERITAEEVCEEARMQGIGDLGEIRVGLIEPDGRFSFIKQDSGDGDSQGPPDRMRA